MATAAEPAPKRRRREETRQRIAAAALPVFARSGYERATVDEIVREAGYSKGAFYVHFESKEDLFWGMLEERISGQQDAFRQALDETRSAEENIQALLTTIFAIFRKDAMWSALFIEFVAHAARNDKVRERLAAMYQNWRDFTVETLNQGREVGRVRKDLDVEFVATVMIALIEGMIMQARLAPGAIRPEDAIEPLSRLLADWLKA
jgi:AcrR family transcriptional regulator